MDSKENKDDGRTPAPLAYDSYVPTRDSRGRLIFVWFWAGALATCCLYMAAIALKLSGDYVMEIFFEAVLIPPMFTVMMLAVATLALGVSVWLRLVVVKEIRFVGFRGAFFTGVVFGAFPAPLIHVLPSAWRGWAVLGMLVWELLYPVIASLWLVPRSALRD